MKNLVVFGTGVFFENRKGHFGKDNIIAFLDNDKKKVGTTKDDIPIYLPEKIKGKTLQYDAVVIMSTYYDAMKNQLLELGVDESKIQSFAEYLCDSGKTPTAVFHKVNGEFCYTGEKKTIALVSHALDLTGAPMVLFHYAKVLKEKGYYPIVLCENDGPLREDIVEAGIPVIIDMNISKRNYWVWSILMNSTMIVVNTVVQHRLIKELNGCDVPVMWWIHEIKLSYDLLAKAGVKPFELEENITAYGVGPVAQKAFADFFGYNIKSFVYGLPDMYSEKKIVFAIVGTIMARKAQDIFIQAIEKLPRELSEKAQFLMVGQLNMGEKKFITDVQSKVRKIENLQMLGTIRPEEMKKFYKDIDVVVCPSREDPMPVVLVEGMMNEKVCIASDATAVSSYITDGENGFVCKTEDAEDLASKMAWIIKNADKINEIGIRGRGIYLNNFSEEIFAENIMNIVDELVNKK